VHLSTTIENPNSHQISARAYLKTLENALIDSVDLTTQTLKTSGELWKVDLNLPKEEEFYKIELTAFDNNSPDHFIVPNAVRITTAGPVVIDSLVLKKLTGTLYSLRGFATNKGSKNISNVKLKIICNDPWVSGDLGNSELTLGLLEPGITTGTTSITLITYVDSLFERYFNIKTEGRIDGWTYWTDTMRVYDPAPSFVEDLAGIPDRFALAQNYPNPFNPETKIRFSIPYTSKVELNIYDLLGSKVARILDEEQTAGNYETTWNAANLPSGVYFYQLKAGEFVETKKMILMK
jgi:hypothetical protein